MNARSLRTLPLLAAALLAAPLHAEILKVPQDFANIQAAVDDAETGDTVLVSKGVYHENVTVGTPGITLRGKSGAVINGNYLNNCILVNASDVEVTGFTLANGGLGQTLVDGGGLSAGGLFYMGTGAKLSRLVVRSCEGWGIRLDGLGEIEKCDVDGVNGAGIRVNTDYLDIGVLSTISKCSVSRCIVGIQAESGPFVIEKNKADRCQSFGILLSVDQPVIDGVILSSVVTGNDSSNNLQYGFYVDNELSSLVEVEKNKSTGNGFGMQVSGTLVSVVANAIEDNSTFGLMVVGTQCVVSANKVRSNGGIGIDIGTPDILLDGSTVDTSHHVEHNVVQDNGGDGIHVASDNNTVHGNVVKGNLGDGIQLEADGVLGNTLEENVVIGNAHDGIDNWAFTSTISDNVCKGNGGADLAGIGAGAGTVTPGSTGNIVGDESGLEALQELDMDTSIL